MHESEKDVDVMSGTLPISILVLILLIIVCRLIETVTCHFKFYEKWWSYAYN